MSTIFYAWGGPRYLLLIFASITCNYLVGLLISSAKNKSTSKQYLIIGLVINFALIGYYKYANFFVDNLSTTNLISANLEEIVLPLGISFFTFQSVSYIIDVYKRQVDVQKNYFDYALYIIFFPQLIAGPIVRYAEVAKAITSRKETLSDVTIGVQRFIVGLGKKMIIANNAGALADEIFNQPNVSTTSAWIGAIAYTLQIYFDFSGYSDMAIGIGRMFGFRFPENFNYPYISKSITEFWRRWHISLSRWFRDYLYIPLGGNRVSGLQLYFNLFLVWFATGLWHGADWVFILWGLYFFVFIIIERSFLLKALSRVHVFFSHAYAMVAVILSWVLFRSEDLSSAIEYYKTMFSLNSAQLLDPQALQYLSQNYILLAAGILLSTPIIPIFRKRYLRSKNLSVNKIGVNILEPSFYMAVFFLSLIYVSSSTFNPFIYFRF